MNISLTRKLSLLSLLSAVPSTVLLHKVYATKSESIDFAELEIMGNRIQKPLEKVLKAAIDARNAQFRGIPAQDSIISIETGLMELMEIEKSVGDQLQFTEEGLSKRQRKGKNAANLLAKWAKIKSSKEDLWTDFIADIRTMITHAGDTSNLILDPDLDSYYLMDITLLALPQTQDHLQEVSAFIENQLSKKSWDINDKIQLAIYADRLQTSDLDRINASGATSINEDNNFYGQSENLKNRLEKSLTEHNQSMGKLLDLLKSLPNSENASSDLQAFRRQIDETTRLNFSLWNVAVEELDVLLMNRIKIIRAERTLSLVIGSIVVLCTIIVALLLGYNISKQLKKFTEEIKKSGKNLNTIGHEIYGASDTLSSSAQSVASSLQETAASIEELSSIEKVNADSAYRAVELSRKCLDGAAQAESEMQRLTSAMQSISESSKRIEDVIEVIEGIAFQTNLLALNAAVEAARAADQGKGFAVVAEAVRSLAQRASTSAKDIRKMIKVSSNSVVLGNSLTLSSSSILEQLVKDIKDIAHVNSDISTASQDQANRLNMINSAINQIDQSTQSNAATALQSAKASDGVKGQVDNLNSLVDWLETIVQGKKSA